MHWQRHLQATRFVESGPGNCPVASSWRPENSHPGWLPCQLWWCPSKRPERTRKKVRRARLMTSTSRVGICATTVWSAHTYVACTKNNTPRVLTQWTQAADTTHMLRNTTRRRLTCVKCPVPMLKPGCLKSYPGSSTSSYLLLQRAS